MEPLKYDLEGFFLKICENKIELGKTKKEFMKKLLAALILSLFLFTASAFADTPTTILPGEAAEMEDASCMTIIETVHRDEEVRAQYFENEESWNLLLSCGIKTGNIHLWMLPFYITRIIEFLIGIAGLVSVLFIIIGGYLYAWGGLTEDKEKGKKAVMYALIGLAIAVLAWIIVNIIQTQLTS